MELVATAPFDYRPYVESVLTKAADECLRRAGETSFESRDVEQRVSQLRRACMSMMRCRDVPLDVDPLTDCDRNLDVVNKRANELAVAIEDVRVLGVTARRDAQESASQPQTTPADVPTQHPGERRDINERMQQTIAQNHEAADWSQRKWADHLKCSASAVGNTRAWETIMAARALRKAERSVPDRRRRASKRRAPGIP
jgi:ribosome-binding protein aMBF1 (putative translation factor)